MPIFEKRAYFSDTSFVLHDVNVTEGEGIKTVTQAISTNQKVPAFKQIEEC